MLDECALLLYTRGHRSDNSYVCPLQPFSTLRYGMIHYSLRKGGYLLCKGLLNVRWGSLLLAVLALIGGAFGIIGSLGLLSLGFGSMLGIIAILLLILSIAELAFGYGAWTLQPWAWTLGVGVEAIGIVLNIIYIIAGASVTSVIVSIIIAAAIIYYLFTPEVKRAFGQA